MAFSFNFSGDDIDPELDNSGNDVEINTHIGSADINIDHSTENAPAVEVQSHDLRQWLHSLPSRISYDTLPIASPHNTNTPLPIPRRSLFDIRHQLMAEDDDDDTLLASLTSTDLAAGIYEGGFKTWESSLDLASLLTSHDVSQTPLVVELGAGSALPTLVLFASALREKRAVRFVCADYNSAVLRLVTVPNLLLAWAGTVGLLEEGEGELEVTREVVEGFMAAVEGAGVGINLLSGPWGEDLLGLIPKDERGTLVLAAETIYSPASTEAFVRLLVGIFERNKVAKAIVAAKRMYFGVGGSVDGLKEKCAELGAVACEIENSGVMGMEQGVGRALVEVQMR